MAYHWTADVQEKVTQYVRAGGFAWVAAEAAGVPRTTFDEWMRRGARSARQPYRGFHDAVLQARAQARLKAEMETRAKFPRDWLRMGPGRERPGAPGWSQPPRATAATGGSNFDLHLAGMLVQRLLQALASTPEVRASVAEAITPLCKPRPAEEG